MNSTIRIQKTQWYWREVLIGGAMAQISYNYFSILHLHFYAYVYVYCYLVGLILLVDSLIGWGKISADGIKMRLGFKNILSIEWNDIEVVKIISVKKIAGTRDVH